MKPALFLILLCTLVFCACTKTDTKATTPLPGAWTLSETLNDPGDGSGTWQPAMNPLTLTFTSDCKLEGNAFPQARTYTVTSDSTLRFTFSDGTFINYNYTLTNYTLALSGGGCIEACGLKFKKSLFK